MTNGFVLLLPEIGVFKVRECTYGVIWLPFVDALAMAMALGVSRRATALLGLGYATGAVIPCPLPLQQQQRSTFPSDRWMCQTKYMQGRHIQPETSALFFRPYLAIIGRFVQIVTQLVMLAHDG